MTRQKNKIGYIIGSPGNNMNLDLTSPNLDKSLLHDMESGGIIDIDFSPLYPSFGISDNKYRYSKRVEHRQRLYIKLKKRGRIKKRRKGGR